MRFLDTYAILRLHAERGYSDIDISRYKSKFKNADEESGEKTMLYLNLSVLNSKKNYWMVLKSSNAMLL